MKRVEIARNWGADWQIVEDKNGIDSKSANK